MSIQCLLKDFAYGLVLSAALFTLVSMVYFVFHPIPPGACTEGDTLCQSGQTVVGNLSWGLMTSPFMLVTDWLRFGLWLTSAASFASVLLAVRQALKR